ncbi:MAG: metal-dependent hydrolase [Candidatus Bathyarchaeota archaeon]|nr:metal-dependent hydrolase [Candidatus Termiticorpusculum sp.]
MSLAYLLGKASSKFLKVNPNIPVLLVLSILPDIDLVVETLTGTALHRGPTHSLIFSLIIFVPFFIVYGKRAVPYFLAYVSHFLIGDFFIGGQLQLFWPLSTGNFGFYEAGFMYINIYDSINIAAELSLFAVAIVAMAKTRDYKIFFRNDKTNLVLIIPIATVLLPTFIGYPFNTPLFLILPLIGLAHLFFLVLFGISVLIVLYSIVKKALTRRL